MADQRAVLALPRGRPVGAGDLPLGQLLGQHLGVVAVGLLLAVGDLVDLGGVGQDDLVGQGLDQLDEPLVAGGGLDDRLEGAKASEELEDVLRVAAGEGAASDDAAVLVEDAEDDRLLVEVDADVVHGDSPGRCDLRV